MTFVYNIDYSIAAACILVITIFYVQTRFSLKQRTTRLFLQCLYLTLICDILDFLTAVSLTESLLISDFINIVLNSIYFATISLCEYAYVTYITAYVPEKKILNVNLLLFRILFTIFCASLIVNVYTGIFFSVENCVFIHGPYYWVCYFVPFICLFFSAGVMLFEKKYYTRRVLFSTLEFTIVTTVSILIQYLFLNNYLLIFFGVSLAALILLFGMETPDYQKLQTTMSNLEQTNQNLHELQAHLQQEVESQTKEIIAKQKENEEMTLRTVESLAHAIDAKDEYTNGHSTRVAQYAVILATALGWEKERVDRLHLAAVLHDIGKIGVPDTILNKPSRLTNVEYEVIKTHTTTGYNIVKDIPSMELVATVAKYHHERYDGKGYPEGLKGDNIPQEARVVGIADAFDAMSSQRVYRKSMSSEAIRKELVRGRGTQFDPDYLDVFLQLFDSHALDCVQKISMNQPDVPIVMNEMERDSLTHLPTRLEGVERIQSAIRDEAGIIALMDIDDLHKINISYGNMIGDRIIKSVADLLIQKFGTKYVCRYGGDEFMLYMKGVRKEIALSYFEEIYESINKLKISSSDEINISVSCAMCDCVKRDVFERVFERVDNALFYVKHSGYKGTCYFLDEQNTYTEQNTRDLEFIIEHLNMDDCSYMQDEFKNIYSIVHKLKEDYRTSICLSMLTLEKSKKNRTYADEMEEAMVDMENAVREVTRNIDYCIRYSHCQLLLILVSIDQEDISTVIDRIFKEYYRYGTHNEIVPSVVSKMYE